MKVSSTFRLLACVVLAVAAAALPHRVAGTGNTVYVGFLDDAREEMVNWKPGVAKDRVIRPAFERSATGWKAIDTSSLPTRMEWTVTFNGRDLGQIEAEASKNRGLTLLQKILTPPSSVPNIGSPSTRFAGIMGLTTKVRRPLVVVSADHFRDPDG